MYKYEIEESTLTSRIFHNDIIIDEKSPWESVESATNWSKLVVDELNNGIELDRFNNAN